MPDPTPMSDAEQKPPVRTPSGCDGCLYRQAEWRDGGHCYMFKVMPSPTCAQFRPALLAEIRRHRNGGK